MIVMQGRHFSMTDAMIYGNPSALDWAICQNVRKLVQTSGDFAENSTPARTMLAFIGHACETSEGGVLMYSVDAKDDEDTCIFITNPLENPMLRDRKIIPNHRYVIFCNNGSSYNLHYVSGNNVTQALPGLVFEIGDPDSSIR